MAKQNKAGGKFHIEFKSTSQKMAWGAFQQHDVLFLLGPAGTGKTFLAAAFAISEVLQGNKKRIILTRPIVESGEKLGFLPGDFNDKVDPYMRPLHDAMQKLLPPGAQREMILQVVEVAPLAYMRGRTFDDAICIFDEAQNATHAQLKMFLSRFGENSKVIVDGDASQVDITDSGLVGVVKRLESLPGVGIMEFTDECIVRHPLVGPILKRLE